MAAEVLGYAGGALVLVGAVLVVARSWESLGSAGRLAITAATGVAAGVAAWRTPAPAEGFDAAQRLKGTLWLVCTLALALAGGVGVHDVMGFTSSQAVVSSGALAGAAVSAVVWRGGVRPVQQATTWLAFAIGLGAVGGHLSEPGTSGVLAAVVGLVAVLVGLTQRSRPSFVAVWCGGVILLVACPMIAGQWRSPGLLAGVTAGSVLAGLAVWPRPVRDRQHVLACAVTGGAILATTAPRALAYHAELAAVVTGTVVWLASVLLMWVASPPHAVRAPALVWVVAAAMFVLGPAVAASDQPTAAVLAGVLAAVLAVTAGVLTVSVPPTLVGALGFLVFVPWAVGRLVPGALAAPLAIVAAGLVIVAAAVWLLRRRGTPSPPAGDPFSVRPT